MRPGPDAGRIDAHHHLWDLAVRDQSWIGPEMAAIRRNFTLDDLEPHTRAAGVTATVLVQTGPYEAETEEFLGLAKGSDLVAGVVGWVDLTAPDVADRLTALRAAPGGEHLVGIRHQVQGEPDPRWLTRPDVLRGLRAVADAGLAYDLLTLPHQLPAATEAVAALPQLTFVLDHLSKPPIASGNLTAWADAIRPLAARPNVYGKLSGLVTEADWTAWTVDDLRPFTDTALDAFGPRRVMFGSDWPVCGLAATYEQVTGAAEHLTAGLSPGERDAVFRDAALRAYGLPGRLS